MALGQQLLQFAVLIFECPQSFGLVDFETAVFAFPHIESALADAVFAAQLGDWRTRLILFEDANDLLLTKLTLSHRLSPR